MANIPKVRTYMHGGQLYAKYTDVHRCFQHSLEMKAPKPFSLVEFEVTSGPHKGKKAITFEPTPYFPFERLPFELRQKVYKLVFAYNGPIYLSKHGSDLPPKWTSLLIVNHAIGSEAKKVLWSSQHFVIESMVQATDFFEGRQRGGRRYITQLTVNKTGPVIAMRFYKSLQPASHLRRLTVRLPCFAAMPLSEHIDKHYQSLREYLCPPDKDLTEAWRRLNTVFFDIGSSQQRSVLDEKGEPLKAMTPELNEWCRRRVRKRLLDHFKPKTVGRTKTIKWSEDSLDSRSGDATQAYYTPGNNDDQKVSTKMEQASAQQIRQQTSIIIIDE